MIIGTVGEIWRYAVKSMGGERLDHCTVAMAGLLGDGGWVLRDDEPPGEALFEFTSPPGTYFDAFPIRLLTTASLRAMARLNPAAVWDARRFRPNIPIETDEGVDGPVEAEWHRRSLRLGDLDVQCEMPTARCGMNIQAQGDLPKDPTVLRTIVRESGQHLGIYASVSQPGRVAVGDIVELR